MHIKMNESPEADENIFKSTDVLGVIEAIKLAVKEGYHCETLNKVLADTFEITKKVTRASGIRLYHVDENTDVVTLEYDDKWEKPGETQLWKAGETSNLPENVVRTMKLPRTTQKSGETEEDISIVFEEDRSICFRSNVQDVNSFFILELCKCPEDDPFSKNDKNIVGAIVGWLVKNLSPAILKRNVEEEDGDLLKERKNTLLNLHQTFLRLCLRPVDDHDSKDNLIEDLMVKMIELLGAERSRIYLFDEDEECKWPPEKCECYESQTHANKSNKWRNKRIIEFSRECDMAWHAVNDKSVVNVLDRNSDVRFKRIFDQMPGQIVNNMLSFPIHGKKKVTGAVSVMNKLQRQHFTKLDEEVCVCIAEYFAFILNSGGLSTKNSQKQLEFEIAHDMFSNRLKPSSGRIELLVNSDISQDLPEGFSKFSWYPLNCEDHLEQLAYFMVEDLIDKYLCPDRSLLAKFVLFTNNLYNPTCFHNFEHAVNVLHCVYIILKRNKDVFNQMEGAALAVTALSHDAGRSGLRHWGVPRIGDIHQQLYEYDVVCGYNSVSERVLGIIKDAGLFENLPGKEYRELMDLVQNCATGTDLTVSYEKRMKMVELLESDEFKLEDESHRSHFMVLVMSAADLSEQTKSIDIAMMITARMYEEFYEKGDLDKASGLCPTERMNRDFCGKIQEQQLFFLTKIVKPVYEIIQMVLPNTKPLLNGIEALITAEPSHYEELAKNLHKA